MGCDIHMFAEKREGDRFVLMPGVEPFDWRSYGMFGFLADVRNYSAVPPIAARRGIPEDASPEVRDRLEDLHSTTWLSVRELLDFDYDQPMEDRRVTRVVGNFSDGGCTCEPGEGETKTFRDFLLTDFFDELEKLRQSGAERIVFGFDS